jgi:hypothetical protein
MDKRRWHWNFWALLFGTLVAFGCGQGKCKTQHVYQGDSTSTGTITYGEASLSNSFSCGKVGDSGQKCMQAPGACTTASFGCYNDGSFNEVGCASLAFTVALARFQNGQVIVLPSPDVAVVASLDGLPYPCDSGIGIESLTLQSGTVSVNISLNNFDAQYDLTLTQPDGTSAITLGGEVAMLNATWNDVTPRCED